MIKTRSWNSSVYVLDDKCLIPGRGRNFSLCHSICTCSGAHSVSFPVGTGGSPGVKQLGFEAVHSPPSIAEVNDVGSCTSTSPYFCMVWCLIKHGKNVTFFMAVCLDVQLGKTPKIMCVILNFIFQLMTYQHISRVMKFQSQGSIQSCLKSTVTSSTICPL